MARTARGGGQAASAARVAAACFDSPANQLLRKGCDHARPALRPARVVQRAIHLLNLFCLAGRGFTWLTRHAKLVARASVWKPARCRLPPAPDGPDSDATAGSGFALHIRNIFRSSIRATRTSPHIGKFCVLDHDRAIECAPFAAQTKVANRDDAKRFAACVRFDAQWAIDTNSPFIGRRRRTDRANDRRFVRVAFARRCSARSSCETFRYAPHVRHVFRADRARSQGGWFDYCCIGRDVTNGRDARRCEERLMT